MTKRLHAWRLTLLLFRIVIALLVVPILALTLYGQAFYGSVVGTITDRPAAALSGVTVTLKVHKMQCGEGGDHRFLNLVPGRYRVDVEQGGFKKATRDNVEVTVSVTVRADIAMQLGEATQTLEVQATAPLLQTENESLSQVVNTRSVEELPVNGRNIMNIPALVPGVVAQGTTSAEVAARAAQVQADSSAVTSAMEAQVINDVPNVAQNPLFYAMLQNGFQPRNETSTSTSGDL